MSDQDPILARDPKQRVIPAPQHLAKRNGTFSIDSATSIVVADSSLIQVAECLAQFLATALGFELQVEQREALQIGAINFRLDEQGAGNEDYELDVSEKRILISSVTETGAFYALQTLRQLLPADAESENAGTRLEVAGVRVVDGPQHAYRGMHLDVSRHFFPVAFVKRYLDWMALYKLNTFHWHLTDDQGWRIEIKKYPRLTEVGAWRDSTVVGHTLGRNPETDGEGHGGFYSQEEIKEVVRYAAERQITIIPEIDLPGHSRALLASYPEYGCREDDYSVATHFGVFRDILCPSTETFSMLRDVLAEVAELFPGPYIHVGGDEVVTNQWQESEKCQAIMRSQGIDDVTQLHQYFMAELNQMVSELGRTAVAWDDILDSDPTDKRTVVAWRGLPRAVDAARQGHDVVVSPGAFYFDSYQSRSVDEPLAIHGLNSLRAIYECEWMPEELEPEHRRNVLGAQGALWTEYIGSESAAEYMAMPRMCALAEQVWSSPSQRSWNSFSQRLRHHLRRLDVLGVNASRSHYKPGVVAKTLPDQSVELTLSSDGNRHTVHYTLDGTRPDQNSPSYEAPLVLTESTTVRALTTDDATGEQYGDLRMDFIQHKAIGCPVTFREQPDSSWGDDSEHRVVNGLAARSGFFLHQDWAGFCAQDMTAEIDLGEVTDVQEVGIGFAAEFHRELFHPTGLLVSVSADGNAWQPVCTQNALDFADDQVDFVVAFEPMPARYVQVICKNEIHAFSHETGQTQAVDIYIDEISVR